MFFFEIIVEICALAGAGPCAASAFKNEMLYQPGSVAKASNLTLWVIVANDA